MKGSLRVALRGTKKEIESRWHPIILMLKQRGTTTPLHFAVDDAQREIKEDVQRGVCYFEIQDLEEGIYELRIADFHTGHLIHRKQKLHLTEGVCWFDEFPARPRQPKTHYIKPRQANTYGMDFIADAPYRLQKSFPYLPILVFAKDAEPGTLKVKTIEVFSYDPLRQPEEGYQLLKSTQIHQVIDSDGTLLEKAGHPVFLSRNDGEEYETVTTDPWYRIILIHREGLPVLTGKHLGYEHAAYLQYKVTIKHNTFLFDQDKEFVFRTLVPPFDLPRMENWYYGDTHYHSEFTDNPYEYGGPLPMTAQVAKAVGLSWVTVTDHSYCLSHPRNKKEEAAGNRWRSYQEAIDKTNESNKSVLLVGAEEITVRKGLSGLHILSFGNCFIEDGHPAGFGSLTLDEVLDRITSDNNDRNGFIYIAHPSSEGYVWNDEDYEVAQDPRYGSLVLGLQIFNEKICYKRIAGSMDRDSLDPFAMLGENNKQSCWAELDQGIKKHWVKKFLLPSLQKFEPNGTLKKYFILAGSDAHMDFNYSFRPHPAFMIHYLNDNAFGKVRTLAHMPREESSELTKTGLYDALRNGRTLLTDGPIALFSLRRAEEEQIYRLGDTLTVSPRGQFTLDIEWQSTPEFGPVERIELYLGTGKGERNLTAQLGLPEGGRGLEGRTTHTFTDWKESPCYLRLEAACGVDPRNKKGLYRCITNPIWIITQ